MELNNGQEIIQVNRFTIFDALPPEVKEYSMRVARNAQIIYSKIVEKGMFEDYTDVDAKNIEFIYEIVKYFDVGLAFKDDKTLFPNKTLQIFHVKKGADVFFAEIKKREDFKSLTDNEKFIRRVAKEVAYYHHERWDGKGYPEGLRKEETPLLARICGVCLAIDNYTYDYKTKVKRSKAEAVDFLTSEAGKSLDPTIALLAVDIIDQLAIFGDAYLTYQEMKEKEAEKNKKKDSLDFEDVTEEKAAIDLDNTDPLIQIQEEEKVVNPTEKKVRKAIKPIEMLFMPVYDIKTENIVYYQTTLVVNDKKLGALMPNVYSLVAEKTKKIAKLVEIGLNQVFYFIKIADVIEHKVDMVSVRMYAKIIEKPTVINKILDQITKSGIDPSRLIFEIPETVLASASETTLETIKKIKDMGIKIAIAEFGFAYSSLHKLSDIEFDILKISREYILDVDYSSRSAGVVRSIIDMVRTLGAEEVCEGVDTEDQKQALIKIGCRKIQGSVVGEPKTSKDLLGF